MADRPDERPTSRRDFLTLGSVLAAGGVLGACSSTNPGRGAAVTSKEENLEVWRKGAGIPYETKAPGVCTLFPEDNYWNTPITDAPVHPSSAAWIATIGAGSTLHPDFGSGEWPPGSGAPIGIPFIEVNSATPAIDVVYTAYGSESDPGPMPIPLDAPIEGGPTATGDRHVVAFDRDSCVLYELFDAAPVGGAWHAASGAVYDLTSNALRPDGWTSADAAGLPILPGLVTYDEVASGSIDHAIRFTAPVTRDEAQAARCRSRSAASAT